MPYIVLYSLTDKLLYCKLRGGIVKQIGSFVSVCWALANEYPHWDCTWI